MSSCAIVTNQNSTRVRRMEWSGRGHKWSGGRHKRSGGWHERSGGWHERSGGRRERSGGRHERSGGRHQRSGIRQEWAASKDFLIELRELRAVGCDVVPTTWISEPPTAIVSPLIGANGPTTPTKKP